MYDEEGVGILAERVPWACFGEVGRGNGEYGLDKAHG